MFCFNHPMVKVKDETISNMQLINASFNHPMVKVKGRWHVSVYDAKFVSTTLW